MSLGSIPAKGFFRFRGLYPRSLHSYYAMYSDRELQDESIGISEIFVACILTELISSTYPYLYTLTKGVRRLYVYEPYYVICLRQFC